MVDQFRDIIEPFPQRWDADLHPIETVKQIFLELLLGDHSQEVEAGRRDDAAVNRIRLGASGRHPFLIFDRSQQPGLCSHRQLGDLIEIDGAFTRCAKQSRLRRSVLGAEEFRLQQIRWPRRTAEGEELLLLPWPCRVNLTGKEFLTGPGLSHQQYVGTGGCDL